MIKEAPAKSNKVKNLKKPSPLTKETPFRYDELFFSITDNKSVITYANDVFIRISRYSSDEIIGRLHKLIRHPDMPRAVFNIFWERLKENKPIASYIKNLSKDGSYYWVMALAFPCKGGYLSIRLKPGSELFKKVQNIYSDTLAHEKEQEEVVDKRRAMNSGTEYLVMRLQKEGFSDYDEFMWNALQTEMRFRENILNADKPKIENTASTSPLQELETTLSELVLSLEELKQIHKTLADNSGYILQLARSIILLSLNAQIGSAKLGDQHASLSAVAENMGEQSSFGEERLLGMQKTITAFSNLTSTLSFDIMSAKLQVEMTRYFLDEISADNQLKPDDAIQLLYNAFLPRLSSISDRIGKLPEYLKKLSSDVQGIERFLLVLRFIHITGKIEVAKLSTNSSSFSTTFQDLLHEVQHAEKRLAKLSDLVYKHQNTASLYSGFKTRLEKQAYAQQNLPVG